MHAEKNTRTRRETPEAEVSSKTRIYRPQRQRPRSCAVTVRTSKDKKDQMLSRECSETSINGSFHIGHEEGLFSLFGLPSDPSNTLSARVGSLCHPVRA